MTNVVPFTGERLTPTDNGNADLALHLRDMAQQIDEGDHGECLLVSVVVMDGAGRVRTFNRSTRHFLRCEYLGILQVVQHQVLNDIHPGEDDDA